MRRVRDDAQLAPTVGRCRVFVLTHCDAFRIIDARTERQRIVATDVDRASLLLRVDRRNCKRGKQHRNHHHDEYYSV